MSKKAKPVSNNKPKVYCNDCKRERQCKLIIDTTTFTEATFSGMFDYLNIIKKYINSEKPHNCIMYKRKWWKIWK